MAELEQFTSLRAALVAALEDAPYLPRDRAAVALALRYADLLDDAQDRVEQADDDDESRAYGRYVAVVAKIGPRLEAVLDRMGMTPGARPAVPGGSPHGSAPDPRAVALEQLQQSAGAPAPGIDPAAFVDPAVEEADAGD
jgi:hypothetical protein